MKISLLSRPISNVWFMTITIIIITTIVSHYQRALHQSSSDELHCLPIESFIWNSLFRRFFRVLFDWNSLWFEFSFAQVLLRLKINILHWISPKDRFVETTSMKPVQKMLNQIANVFWVKLLTGWTLLTIVDSIQWIHGSYLCKFLRGNRRYLHRCRERDEPTD